MSMVASRVKKWVVITRILPFISPGQRVIPHQYHRLNTIVNLNPEKVSALSGDLG
jgi:hypothetical protein